MEETTKRFHYGWVVATVCLLMIVCSSLFSGGMSIALSGVRKVYGLSGTETSMFITVRAVFALLIVIFIDKWYTKLGLRKGVTIGIILGAVGMVLFAYAEKNITMYYIASAFGGICYGLCMMVPAAMLMKNWFNSNRVLCLGICSAGTGVSLMIFSPLLQAIINGYGMTAVYMFQAVFFTAVGALAFLLLRDTPAEKGLEPVGGKDYVPKDAKKAKTTATATNNTNRVYLGNGSILVMALFIVFLGVSASPTSASMALAFNWSGINSMLVATAASVGGLALIVGKIAYGASADRFGQKAAVVFYTSIAVIAYLAVFVIPFFSEQAVFLMFLAYIFQGIGGSVCSLGYPVWAMDYSKAEDYPKTLKKFQLGYQTGTLVGSPFPGIIADVTGSYYWFFIVPSLGYGLTAAFAMYLYWKLGRLNKQANENSASTLSN